MLLIGKIIKLPHVVFTLFKLTQKSSLKTIGDRWEIFKVLIKLVIRLNLKRTTHDLIAFKLFTYTIYANSYQVINDVFRTVFVDNTYYFSCKKSNPTIIDAGAHLGMAIIYWKKLFPACRVIGYEPNPQVFELLKKNISTNHLSQVEIHQKALDLDTTKKLFYIPLLPDSQNGSLIKTDDMAQEIWVETIPLSLSLPEREYDLLKIDTEGSEDKILEDLISHNKIKFIKTIILEYHPKLATTALPKILENLAHSGFDVHSKNQENSEIMVYANREN